MLISKAFCSNTYINEEDKFIIFVDKMDGDIYYGVSSTLAAIKTALLNNANEVKCIKYVDIKSFRE